MFAIFLNNMCKFSVNENMFCES